MTFDGVPPARYGNATGGSRGQVFCGNLGQTWALVEVARDTFWDGVKRGRGLFSLLKSGCFYRNVRKCVFL